MAMTSAEPPPSKAQTQVPSSTTFSFKAPFPASSSGANPLKQRRVSLALPSNSPRLVQAWSFRDDTGIDAHVGASSSSATPEKRGKMRKITAGSEDDGAEAALMQLEKKPRKKWTAEETQMLVDGCNRHGVGNWKTILSDPSLTFDNRSPVDLKDRFRTYFPDAYKQHYPNARTHLSSKIRSTLPDGSSLFEKTRSKRRRPFTEEEDKALKAGYEKHGTVWAAIVKDPVFAEQNRRSTDLRDRFRNAFPELYQAAGYKPRSGARFKGRGVDGDVGTGVGASTPPMPVREGRGRKRAATDDQLGVGGSGGPVRSSRRRAATSQGLLRGGTKSVPQSTACSEDEDSDVEADEETGSRSPFKVPLPPTRVTRNSSSAHSGPVLVDNVSTPASRSSSPVKIPHAISASSSFSSTTTNSSSSAEAYPFLPDEDDEMELVGLDDPLSEYLSSSHQRSSSPTKNGNSSNGTHHDNGPNGSSANDMDALPHWSSGIDTPTHSHHAWSTPGPGSPTSSHLSLSDMHSSPFHRLNSSNIMNSNLHVNNNNNNNTMIGKSAWGAQDWFSPNPRLGTHPGGADSSGASSTSSFLDGDDLESGGHLSPASPFSLHAHLNHGVMERYDLFPAMSMSFGGSGGGGGGGTDFSSELGVGETHSTFSDELWTGNGHAGGGVGGGFRGFTHHSSYAGDLIFGARSHQPAGPAQMGYYGFGGFGGGGLGLTGMSGLGGSAPSGTQSGGSTGAAGGSGAGGGTGSIHPMQLHTPALPGIDEIELTGITLNDSSPPSASMQEDDVMDDAAPLSSLALTSPQKASAADEDLGAEKPFSLDDLVDLDLGGHDDEGEVHATPPGTPLLGNTRSLNNTGTSSGRPLGMRRSSAGQQHNPHGSQHGAYYSSGMHARSISVPPSEARGAGVGGRQEFGQAAPFFPPAEPQQDDGSATSSSSSRIFVPVGGMGTGILGGGGDMYDLPFLDLHYYYGNSAAPGGGGGVGMNVDGPSQALDLASTASSFAAAGAAISALGGAPSGSASASSNSFVKATAALRQHTMPLPSQLSGNITQGGTIKARSQHQRGQSAVCPQDLMLSNGGGIMGGDGNKRKRASWDGGHV